MRAIESVPQGPDGSAGALFYFRRQAIRATCRRREAKLLNEVSVEGTVIGNSWRWSADTLFRIGVDRDLHRSRKGPGPHDASDYFTVRATAQVLGVIPVQFRQGMRLRVHGFLQSREHAETLKAYLIRAHGPTGALAIDPEMADQVTVNRVVTEVMAERITILPDQARTSLPADSQPAKVRRDRKAVPQPQAPVPEAPQAVPALPSQTQPAEA